MGPESPEESSDIQREHLMNARLLGKDDKRSVGEVRRPEVGRLIFRRWKGKLQAGTGR
jgi:hypothetical protein